MATSLLPSIHEEPTAMQFAAPPSPSSSVVVKLSMRGETYRMTFAIAELTYAALAAKVHDCYDDAHRPHVWGLVYRDDEDDLITVNNEREFREAFRVFAELKEQPATANGECKMRMHFHVVAKLSLREQLAPVMQTVSDITDRMSRLAVDTRNSFRKSSYVERGRESLYYSAVRTRDVLSSGGRGFSQRVRRASTEISGRLRTRVSSQDAKEEAVNRESLMVVNVEQDAAGNAAPAEMDVRRLLAQARAQEEEAERTAGTNEVDSTAEEGTSDADTASTVSDSEWDMARATRSTSTASAWAARSLPVEDDAVPMELAAL